MRFDKPLLRARFVKRLNRFAVEVNLEGERELAHLPNSGRLGELLYLGNRIFLAPCAAPHRKTSYDLLLARFGPNLVSVDARLSNHLVAEATSQGRLQEFQGYERFQREVPQGGSRLDFAFLGPAGRRCLVEVKSVTLVEDGVALFPDAPTLRGLKHLNVLTEALGAEHTEALVLFVVQRSDARLFSPNDRADPDFARALRQAAARGVRVGAYTCRVSTRSVVIHKPLPVEL
jgi:sugar fermentation stimulation protein A